MAKDTRVSGSEFYLDTASFDEAAKLCKDLAEKMTSLKNNMDGKKNNLMFSWAGAGRDMFEKKYRVLSQQFGDLEELLEEAATQYEKVEDEVDKIKFY